MACSECGARRGHVSGCRIGRLDPGLDSRVRKALKDENPVVRGRPEQRAVKAVVTERSLRAQKKAQQKRARENPGT
jgi:hypothetical protein